MNTQEIALEDLLSKGDPTLTTEADVVTKHIVDYWKEHLDEITKELSERLPHTDIISDVLKRLFTKLGVAKVISSKIGKYIESFPQEAKPTVIGDYASLTLNNFVTTVGRHFMKDSDLAHIIEKAKACRLNIDITSEGWDKSNRRQPLIDTLKRLDESVVIINNAKINTEVLRHLPFWKNYERWQNFFLIGLVCASDISSADMKNNAKIKELIDITDSLYN